MKKLIVYGTQYGTTKRYAEKFSEIQMDYEEIDCLWYSVWYDKTLRREIFRNHGSSMYELYVPFQDK